MTQVWVFADIGNTATKIACAGDNSHKRPWTRLWTWTGDELRWQVMAKRPAQWVIASVNPHRLRSLMKQLKLNRPDDRVRILKRSDVPLRTSVEQPNRLGIDRKLAAWGAWQLNDQRGPIIVVQFGTAVTVNLVDEKGVFCGGLIYPSLALCRRVLAEKTAALPDLSSLPSNPRSSRRQPAFGRNTKQAIVLGTLQQQIGGVLRAVDQIQQTLAAPATVFVGGGGLAEVAPWLPQSFRREPDLVLRAISMLAKR